MTVTRTLPTATTCAGHSCPSGQLGAWATKIVAVPGRAATNRPAGPAATSVGLPAGRTSYLVDTPVVGACTGGSTCSVSALASSTTAPAGIATTTTSTDEADDAEVETGVLIIVAAVDPPPGRAPEPQPLITAAEISTAEPTCKA